MLASTPMNTEEKKPPQQAEKGFVETANATLQLPQSTSDGKPVVAVPTETEASVPAPAVEPPVPAPPAPALSPPVAGKLTTRTPNEILGMEFRDDDNIIGDRLLANGQMLTVLGEGGLGKSRLLLQMTACSITGRDIVGIPTYNKELRWLIIQAENSSRRLKEDLQHLRAWVGDEDWKRVNEQLIIHTLETDEDGILDLDDLATCARVLQLIQDTKPDVVALDSLYCFTSGELNADKEMRAVCSKISRVCKKGNPERAVIVLHHATTGRAGAAKATGIDRSSFGRNSKVLQAWTRAQINLAPGGEEGLLLVSCGKNNNGRSFEPFAVRLKAETMIYEVDEAFDIGRWEQDIRSPKPGGEKFDLSVVSSLCEGQMDKAALAKALIAETACSQATAYRRIDTAAAKKILNRDKTTKLYTSAAADFLGNFS